MRNLLWLLIFLGHALWGDKAANADSAEFKIGVSLPLTGPLAEYGEAVRNGIQLAQDSRPKEFAHLQFLYEDNGYDGKRAVSTFQKLRELDQVELLFVWGNEPALALAPLAEAQKFPLIAASQHPQVSQGKHYVIRFINNGADYSKALLGYLRTLGVRKIALVQSELSFFHMLSDALKEAAKDEQIEIVDRFLPSDSDFRTSIAKLRTKSFDILGVYLLPPQVRAFFTQAHELKLSAQYFGATTFESKAVIASAWPLMEGAVFTHNAVSEEFRSRYIALFGNDMQLAYAANAFDFATLTAKLFGASPAPTRNAERILAAYRGAPEAIGAAGAYRFLDSNSDGPHFSSDIVVRKISGNTTQEVYRLSMESLR